MSHGLKANSFYSLCVDPIALNKIGDGYVLYFLYLKHIAIMFLVISIFISVPCVGIAAGQNAYEKGLTNFGYNKSYAEAEKDYVKTSSLTDASYVENLSAGKVFTNPLGTNFTSIYTMDSTTTLFRADMLAYLNILGAIYVLIHSVILRRMLVRTSSQLDNVVSP